MKPGDIILVHTKEGVIPKAVQYFQEKYDKESGRWNHSMRYYGVVDGVHTVLEAAIKEWDDNDGNLTQARACFNPLSNYSSHPDKYELLVLTPKMPYNKGVIQRLMMKWEGTPYDYHNLLGDQIVQYLTGWWWGRKKKRAAKKMVCHELTMKVDNEYRGTFSDWNKAKVSDIYWSVCFEHKGV